MIRLIVITVVLVVWSGCDGITRPDRSQADVPRETAPVRLDPFPVQQARAYPETVTGRFLSLVDFEDVPGGMRGHEYVRHFEIVADKATRTVLEFVVNITRTGAGAMEALLPAGGELVFNIPDVHDFSGYTLLSLALYSRTLRDDFQVTLNSPDGNWTSHRRLVLPGWNNVLFDIRRLEKAGKFNVRNVTKMRLAFADSTGPVSFNIDDIMLINNRRTLKGLPDGMSLEKIGLDYRLTAPGLMDTLEIAQSRDGLWRWGKDQTVVRLSAKPGPVKPGSEQLQLMGARRVGRVTVIERNGIRLRLANTWYFPTRAGEWASLAVRRMQWQHTFYADGRHVVHLELNNAGGREISSVRLDAEKRVAWAGREKVAAFVQKTLRGPIGRWSFLSAPQGTHEGIMLGNYLSPAKVTPTLATTGAFAPGDVERDGFDESQGCYYLKARSGHCRFRITPPKEGLFNAVFRVAGNWAGPVSVNSAGRTIRDVVMLEDGSILFQLKGWQKGPISVEVQGKVDILKEE